MESLYGCWPTLWRQPPRVRADQLVSLCAGQGHDVVGVLEHHLRRDEVAAVLVEADPRNAELGRRRAAAAGLAQVEVREADASRLESFADALPADVLLLCGIFGNVSEADIERTAAAAPALCAAGATVIFYLEPGSGCSPLAAAAAAGWGGPAAAGEAHSVDLLADGVRVHTFRAAEAQLGGTSSSSTSARPARSGSCRVGAGSARSARRLIQIERMPRSWAGTMSWKWL